VSKWVTLLIGIGVLVVAVGGGYYWYNNRTIIDPKGQATTGEERMLEKYDFDSLRKRVPVASEIQILGPIKEVEDRRANLNINEKYTFTTREINFESDGKRVSGMINYFPEKSSLSKVVVMIRGYAEKTGYYPGSGTWRVADELAKEGYTTISLDFLGYGHSDMESTDMLEARFHKVVEVLDLLESIKQIPWVDKSKIGFWAHSNGGQILMSVLEVTGDRYPSVMWAPMTQPFPESVLTTIDEGSPVKVAIEEFEKHYDSRRYAFENYYKWINSPVVILQGTKDEWVKLDWQKEVVSEMQDQGKNIELVVFEGADHNLKSTKTDTWEVGVSKTIGFYDNNL
jgi:alpha-beta hydrolase superfamily lysophospholipase